MQPEAQADGRIAKASRADTGSDASRRLKKPASLKGSRPERKLESRDRWPARWPDRRRKPKGRARRRTDRGRLRRKPRPAESGGLKGLETQAQV